MVTKLSGNFSKLQRRYDRLKKDMLTRDDLFLNQPPQPDKWSALQVVYHLYLSETLSVSYLAKKISSGPHPSTGMGETLRYLLLKYVLATPLKFKAPRAVGENLPDNLEKIALFKDYDETRENLRTMLDSFPADRLNEAIYKHPKVGYLNMEQTVGFLYAHFIHHEKQIRHIIS